MIDEENNISRKVRQETWKCRLSFTVGGKSCCCWTVEARHNDKENDNFAVFNETPSSIASLFLFACNSQSSTNHQSFLRKWSSYRKWLEKLFSAL